MRASVQVYVDVPLQPKRSPSPLSPQKTPVSKRLKLDDCDKTCPPPAFQLSPTLTTNDHLLSHLTDDEEQEDALEFYIDDDVLLEGEKETAAEGDIPIRLLHDLTIFDQESSEMVPLARLLELRPEYGNSRENFYATGVARPWLVENIDSDDEDSESDEGDEDDQTENDNVDSIGQCIKTSRIENITFYDYPPDTKRMDRNIYIQTRSAWYILGMPSKDYERLYIPLWTKIYILHLAVAAAMREVRVTYDEFLQDIADHSLPLRNPVVSPKSLLGGPLEKADIEEDDVRVFLASAIYSICEDCDLKLKRSPLLKYLSDVSKSSPTLPKAHGSSTSARRKDGVPEQAKATVITPVVGKIANQLFNNSFRVVGEPREAEEVAEAIAGVREHHEDPTSIVWNEPSSGHDNYYQSVIIDGVKYEVGDVVMVIPGEDPNKIRARNDKTEAAQSPNQYGNQLWFCQVFYFFEEKGRKLFHGQWLVHGSKTILQEAAHSKSLFLIHSCATNPVASIFKKCRITWLQGNDKEPSDDRDPRSERYHCGFSWDEENAAFIDRPTDEEYQLSFFSQPRYKPCHCCGLEELRDEARKLRRVENGFCLHDVTYHQNDFVYIRPKAATANLFEIGQIVHTIEIESNQVRVRFLSRYEDHVVAQKNNPNVSPQKKKELVSDERRLYLTSRTGDVDPERLNGRCYVRYLKVSEKIEKWLQYDDHFYLNQKGDMKHGLFTIDKEDLERCEDCFQIRIEEIKRAEELLEQNRPLRGLELFSGKFLCAGGLGTGMDMSGYVETKWAVEYSPPAAETYRYNHPQTIVYCQDSSLLLKNAIETHEGKQLRPLLSNDGKTMCSGMPEKNEVDFIFGGPPCQAFSGANHSKRADDIRSTMPCNMLSYLEHYNTPYFLLENVRGLLHHPLLSEQSGHALSGGIQAGMVKFIMRTLIALGYQVHWKLLQAGQYGLPQNRERVIFWAAKRGLPLPKHPVPMYAWKKGANSSTLPIGGKLPPLTRSVVSGEHHQCAPLMPITVDAAISDLPKFDWINPHEIIGETAADRELAIHRREVLNIPRFKATFDRQGSNEFSNYPGYPKGVEYETKPQNRFQMWLRQGMGEDEKVQGHYTRRFSELEVEATTTVPLEPGADHEDLPKALQPTCNKAEGGRPKSFYGRLLPDGHFTCTLTQLNPRSKNARPLHPDQQRIVTIRECARSQGFPDHYIFKSPSSGSGIYRDQMRQIGNAVPVPLAIALGKELGVAMVKEWERARENGNSVEDDDGYSRSPSVTGSTKSLSPEL